VHREQPVGQLGEHADRHRPAAEVRPGAALLGHGTGDDERSVVIGLGAGVDRPGQRGGTLGQPQPALDQRLPGVGAHPGGVGPAAEQQVQTGDDHRLAGSGLAGDHGQPGAQVEGGVVDHAETADAHLLEHGPQPIRLR
jgi:hypothetical protein